MRVIRQTKIALLKHYSVPVHNPAKRQTVTIDATIATLQATLVLLKAHSDRLEFEIKSEIEMLEGALNGAQETYSQVKRRISRLKGSLQYSR